MRPVNDFCYKMLQRLWEILTRIRLGSEVKKLGVSLIRVTKDAKQPISIANAMDIISTDFGRSRLLVNKVLAIIQKLNVADLGVDVWNLANELYLMGFIVSPSVVLPT